jgi:hypothetical protein
VDPDELKAPPASGGAASRQTIRGRIGYHYRGNAEGSTLRLTLGCLLADDLGLVLRRVGGGRRMTFGLDGERWLTEWMADHSRVVSAATPQPWLVEHELIRTLALPLNLDQNWHSRFHQRPSALLAQQRAIGRSRPVEPWPRRCAYTAQQQSIADAGSGGGSGSARSSRSSLLREVGIANRPHSRVPARPANARATCSNSRRSGTVRRAYRVVSPSTCSANVRAGQSPSRAALHGGPAADSPRVPH